MSDLIDRLRGIYRIPITDGLGPAGGDEPDNPTEFVRHFEVPPIHQEAAAALELLGAAVQDNAALVRQQASRIRKLQAEVARLRDELAAAHTIISRELPRVISLLEGNNR
jgi:hypothetical protein